MLTGGAGRIASALRPRLARRGRVLRLLDVHEPADPAGAGEEFVRVAVTDQDAMTDACRGAAALVHLGGDPSERPWAELVETNITGAYVALESARAAGVESVFLASSLHCVGYETFAAAAEVPVLRPRPDTLYGVTKAAGEALGSLYADRFGLTVVAARIMEFGDEPDPGRGRSTWLSPDDAARLVEAAVGLRRPGCHVVWGVSRNTGGAVPLGPGEAIGFFPEDDAGEADAPPAASGRDLIAGSFIDDDRPVGTDWSRA